MTSEFMIKARKAIAVASMSTLLAMGVVSVSSAPANAAACASSAITVGDGLGAGTAFEISTPAQLQWLTLQMNAANAAGVTAGKFYKVTANLGFDGCDFSPSTSAFPFRGSLDGGNFTISNYKVTASGYAAIFGQSQGAVLKDIVIDRATISGGSLYTGALLGLADVSAGIPTILNNITVRNSTISGGDQVGGVAGAVIGGSGNNLNLLRVENSNVTGEVATGGIIGRIKDYPTLIKSGFFGGTVSQASTANPDFWIGGLVGLVEDRFAGAGFNFEMSEVAFRGNLNLTAGTASDIGFLVGYSGASLSVTDSYVRGVARVFGSTVVGGVVGTAFGNVSLSRGSVRTSVLQGQTQTQVAAHPFNATPANINITTTLTTMFYDAERHTSWVLPPVWAGKTATELETYSTFGPLPGWSFGNPTPGTWYWNDDLEGKLFLGWEYEGLTLTPCPVGKYSVNAIVPCIAVPLGHFNALTGRLSFTPCPEGSFQANAGATACEPAPAGRYVPIPAQTLAVDCPAGTFQNQTGQISCINAQPGFFTASAGSVAQTPCEPGTFSDVGATSCFAVSTNYEGPIVSTTAGSASVGQQVVLTGSRLSQVSAVSISGKSAVATCTDTSCSFTVPAGVSAGLQDLVLLGSHGVLTIQGGIRIVTAVTAEATSVTCWTKKISDTEVKVYALNLVGAGKVQYFVNGKEVAWVNAADSSDPKLRVVDGSSYMVRTLTLVEGQKNVIEIHVDGERLRRAAYAG